MNKLQKMALLTVFAVIGSQHVFAINGWHRAEIEKKLNSKNEETAAKINLIKQIDLILVKAEEGKWFHPAFIEAVKDLNAKTVNLRERLLCLKQCSNASELPKRIYSHLGLSEKKQALLQAINQIFITQRQILEFSDEYLSDDQIRIARQKSSELYSMAEDIYAGREVMSGTSLSEIDKQLKALLRGLKKAE